MNGLHLIGDLSGCRCDPQLLLDGKGFEAICVEMVRASGLTVMDARFHQFEGSGFTGAVVLAESHLAIHTWPEKQGLSLDVYVCNYKGDNSAKGRQLFESIVAHFQPGEVARHEVDRGEHHCPGEAGTVELVEAGVHDGQARSAHEIEAHRLEALGVAQQLRLAATAVQITDEMQPVHARAPRKMRRRNPLPNIPGCAFASPPCGG